MKKKKITSYDLIKTKVCSAGYHYEGALIDPWRVGKGGIVKYKRSYNSNYQFSFKVLNTAFRALADFNKTMKCGCKAEVQQSKY